MMRTLRNHFVSSIEGTKLNGFVLHVDNVSRGRYIEETNFELYLETSDGESSQNPVVGGKYFSGRGEFYKPWLEVYYRTRVKLKSSRTVDLSERHLGEKLFKCLLDALPPGAHIMVAYVDHQETRRALEQGVPAPVTPIGYLLWKSGCTWFKDWYFAEGLWEGDVKLQGTKPLNEEARRKNLLETHKDLTEFLKTKKGKTRIVLDARSKAEEILKQIAGEILT